MTSDVRAICVSHSPVFGHADMPAPAQEPAVREAYALLAADVARFDPELVLIFAPDHFNAFDYRAMPPFCVGLQGSGAGDFGGPAGAVSIDSDQALSCAATLTKSGFDVAISHRMKLDHGYTQPLMMLFGATDRKPIVPIFINCAAPPLPGLARVQALGAAVGSWAAGLNQRVLLIGSGGLSHDPPVPSIEGAPPGLFEFLVTASSGTPDGRLARDAPVLEAVKKFAAGESDLLPLNRQWDTWLIDKFCAGALDEVAALSDRDVGREGGRGGQEIRTWLAALSALQINGEYRAKSFFYDTIPEWLAGMGMMAARTVPPTA